MGHWPQLRAMLFLLSAVRLFLSVFEMLDTV